MKINKKERVLYYKDELNDDFGNIELEQVDVPSNYKYIRSKAFDILFSSWFYWIVLKTFLGLYTFFRGYKIIGRENLKTYYKVCKENNSAGFIYSNHTSNEDAFDRQVRVISKRRVNVLANSNILSQKFLTFICKSGGYIPLGRSLKSQKEMLECFKYYLFTKKQDILIYPEAHIWPYYTKIRPLRSAAFHYPAKFFVPVLPVVTVYLPKKRKNAKPRKALVIGEPILPKKELSVSENKVYLRDETQKAMETIASSYKQVEYIKYIKVED